MTFGAQADANRRAESITSPEIGFVTSNSTAGIPGRKIRTKGCLSPEIGFVPSNAFCRRTSNRRRSVMKFTKGPQKSRADRWQPRRQLTDNPHDRRSNRLQRIFRAL